MKCFENAIKTKNFQNIGIQIDCVKLLNKVNMKRFLIGSLFLFSLFISSCIESDDYNVGEIEGYAPVYISRDKAFSTSVKAPQSIDSPGKMYLYNNFIYVSDRGKGVHIIDNSIPTSPVKLKFIEIPGVNDVVVKNGILYADNLTDLVAFDISDLANINLTKRVKNVYPTSIQLYPDFATGYFECVDTNLGYVTNWVKKTLKNPKCYR